ncbi:hypothetical protein Tsubulata_014328 [Turnera subulata]|uniref:RBR-type E3 ubiquitin transferase n=1 Tax=Turnera subulata TaxID=218843 RepID=A0A9Q0JDU5_9ROSI|nr:hypothetical protein Tsubulata_014328 [Turnera subulata]
MAGGWITRYSVLELLPGTLENVRASASFAQEASKQTPSSTNPDYVDEFYFSAIIEDEEAQPQQPAGEEDFQVSDAKYAEGLQFQEALMGSVIVSQMKNIAPSPPSLTIIATTPLLKLDDDEEEMEGKVVCMEMVEAEPGQSSLSFCEICVERKENDEMFKTEGCLHSFCKECISKHVGTKVQECARVVTCPGLDCRAVLELDACRAVLSKWVIDIWEEALCEEVIGASHKFYCPFKDCSALLVNDNDGEEVIRESECPFCHRLFCAQCYVPWHSGVGCEEFMMLNEDERGREDLMVRELAKDKKWSRCPQCKFFVERTEGCPHMTCRCSFQFCYGCGAEWTQSHGGCTGV